MNNKLKILRMPHHNKPATKPANRVRRIEQEKEQEA
jgi:hypothetical protein